jgi:hypothetical protein
MIKTLLRFSVGVIIGLWLVALFSTNALLAIVIAVLCGAVTDKLLKK